MHLEISYSLFIALIVVGIGTITWKLANKSWKIMPKRDPRWKNYDAAIDYLFGSLTIGGTMIIAIIGYVN